jgi:hypothetical protein
MQIMQLLGEILYGVWYEMVNLCLVVVVAPILVIWSVYYASSATLFRGLPSVELIGATVNLPAAVVALLTFLLLARLYRSALQDRRQQQ